MNATSSKLHATSSTMLNATSSFGMARPYRLAHRDMVFLTSTTFSPQFHHLLTSSPPPPHLHHLFTVGLRSALAVINTPSQHPRHPVYVATVLSTVFTGLSMAVSSTASNIIDDLTLRMTSIDAPDWYINAEHKVLLNATNGPVICAATPLTFAEGLLDAVQSGLPPSVDWFTSLPRGGERSGVSTPYYSRNTVVSPSFTSALAPASEVE